MPDIRARAAQQNKHAFDEDTAVLPALLFNAADVGDDLVQYMTNFGRYTIPREYPMAQPCELYGLAVNLLRFVVPAGGSIQAVVIRNGRALKDLTVTYGPGDTGVRRTSGRASLEAGDTIDLQVTTSGLGSDVEISATIGMR